MNTIKELTCVVCPAGCGIKVELDGEGKIVSVTGNTCFRGKEYAESEITNPTRTLTSTVPVYFSENAAPVMLPVRTNKPIPKGKLTEAMEIIHGTKITSADGVKSGSVVIADFSRKLGLGDDVDLIACKSITPHK